MTEETEELLTGRAGEEARQGFTPMPLADAPPQEDLTLDASVENFVATRDDPAPVSMSAKEAADYLVARRAAK